MNDRKKNNGLDLDAETLNRLQQVIDMLGERTEAIKVSGLSRGAIQKIYYGQSSPKFETVKRLCLSAGISMDWLATGRATISNTNDDPWQIPSAHSFVYEIDKKPKKDELAYIEREDGKGLLGLIKSETGKQYTVTLIKPDDCSKGQELKLEKSDLKKVVSARIVKTFI